MSETYGLYLATFVTTGMTPAATITECLGLKLFLLYSLHFAFQKLKGPKLK